mgnify:CR=1 FL=1
MAALPLDHPGRKVRVTNENGRRVVTWNGAGELPGRTEGKGGCDFRRCKETEVAYLKAMKDQAELKKFDEYVESFIDPRKPGNMKWLMEVYPDYVNRRLQQAHTDYEYALRNQMIDCWGINTFDDLHFKYLVDQKKISGPQLATNRAAIDASYTPGWLSPYNFQSPKFEPDRLYLPYSSAQHGRRYPDAHIDRSRRMFGNGNTDQQLAAGMYDVTPPPTQRGVMRNALNPDAAAAVGAGNALPVGGYFNAQAPA